jgi:hypothetical protein
MFSEMMAAAVERTTLLCNGRKGEPDTRRN